MECIKRQKTRSWPILATFFRLLLIYPVSDTHNLTGKPIETLIPTYLLLTKSGNLRDDTGRKTLQSPTPVMSDRKLNNDPLINQVELH